MNRAAAAFMMLFTASILAARDISTPGPIPAIAGVSYLVNPDPTRTVLSFSSLNPLTIPDQNLLTGKILRIRYQRTFRLIEETDLFATPVTEPVSDSRDWLFPLFTYRGDF